MGSKGKVELGYTYRDRITSFTGVATVLTEYLNGCVRCVLEPGLNSDGELIKGETFDIQQLILVPEKPRIKGEITLPTIPMEAEVRDTITGVQGIVTARSTAFIGRPELSIQPTDLNKDGTTKTAYLFYEARVELVKKEPAATKTAKPTGGPQNINPSTPYNRTL